MTRATRVRHALSATLVFAFLGCSNLPPKEMVEAGFIEQEKEDIPLNVEVNHPIHHFDSGLAFQPRRIWRLYVSWAPDPEDLNKSIVHKRFMLVVSEPAERASLEKRIAEVGGDEPYLKWLESKLHPIGNWDVRRYARIARLEKALVAVIGIGGNKSQPREGQLAVAPIEFPEPVLIESLEACSPQGWEFLVENESFGIEVVLESHKENPEALRWLKVERNTSQIEYAAWSFAQGKRIVYRLAGRIKKNFSRCPLPPHLAQTFQMLHRWQQIGVDW